MSLFESLPKRHLISLLIITGITLAIYIQSVNFGFINFDDHTILIQNKPFFTTDFSIKKIFTTDAFIYKESSFYRPLQNLSFAFDASIAGGIVPWSFHLTNLMLFILIGISLYFFLLKFEIKSHFALLGTLLFVANPLNTWPAVWIPSRGDLLLTLFTLLSFICFINFLKTNKYTDLLCTFLFFTLALFAKETAALIPVLFLFYFFHAKCKITCRHFLLAGLMLCVGILWYYLRYQAIIHLEKTISWHDFLYNLKNIPVALSQIVIPYEMSPFPRFTATKIVLGSIISVILLFIIIKKTESTRMEKLFFLCWFLLFLFPTFFIKLRNIDYFEHRYLLPQIGVLIFVFKMLQDTSFKIHVTSYKLRITNFVVISFIIFVFGITSFIKAQHLQTPFTVVDAVVKYDGIRVIPYTNRGVYYVDNEMYEKAIPDFDKALQLDPVNYGVLNNLAKLNMIYEEYENAIALYNISLSINKKVDGAYYNRSIAKTYLGDYEGALLDMDSAIMVNKNVALHYNNRGVMRMNFGYTEAALSDFDEAIRLSNSTYGDAFANRAIVHYHLGNRASALKDCEKALQFEPNNEELLMLKNSIRNEY